MYVGVSWCFHNKIAILGIPLCLGSTLFFRPRLRSVAQLGKSSNPSRFVPYLRQGEGRAKDPQAGTSVSNCVYLVLISVDVHVFPPIWECTTPDTKKNTKRNDI